MPAEESVLLGQVAVDLGYLRPEQLDRITTLKLREPDTPLGEILVRQGLLGEPELRAVLEEQQRRLGRHPAYAAKPRRDVLFGKLCVRHAIVPEDEVNRFLALQARLQESYGSYVPLGVLLAQAGRMSMGSVQQVLSFQEKRVLSCASCGRRYNAALYDAKATFRCQACGHVLTVPEVSLDLNVAGEVYPDGHPSSVFTASGNRLDVDPEVAGAPTRAPLRTRDRERERAQEDEPAAAPEVPVQAAAGWHALFQRVFQGGLRLPERWTPLHLAGAGALCLLVGTIAGKFILKPSEPGYPPQARLEMARQLLDKDQPEGALALLEGVEVAGAEDVRERARLALEWTESKVAPSDPRREQLLGLLESVFLASPEQAAAAKARLVQAFPGHPAVEAVQALVPDATPGPGTLAGAGLPVEVEQGIHALMVRGDYAAAWVVLHWAGRRYPDLEQLARLRERCDSFARGACRTARDQGVGADGELDLARRFGVFPWYEAGGAGGSKGAGRDWTLSCKQELDAASTQAREGHFAAAAESLRELALEQDDPMVLRQVYGRVQDMERAAMAQETLAWLARYVPDRSPGLDDGGRRLKLLRVQEDRLVFQDAQGGARVERTWGSLAPAQVLDLLAQAGPRGAEALGAAAIALELGQDLQAHALAWQVYREPHGRGPAAAFAVRRLGVQEGASGLDLADGRLVGRD